MHNRFHQRGEHAVVTELVVLLDDHGNAVGSTGKATVHHRSTPLHLAFSCYVFDGAGRLLITRRALGKTTWPGVWTNSCCGHPAPGEPITGTVARRLTSELGTTLRALDLVLPRFRYRAVMADGTVENEVCPVFRATIGDGLRCDPSEVDAVRWVDWTAFAGSVLDGSADISPWCALQVRELAELGPDPGSWPVADPAGLPPAARAGAFGTTCG
jgi:isopentenyl-diphosphate delta-isomerase